MLDNEMNPTTFKKLATVIPTYKESEHMTELVHQISGLIPSANILIINESPSTHTKEIITELNRGNVSIMNWASKLGRGSAVLEDMQIQLRLNFDYYLDMDVDFSYPLQTISSMLKLTVQEKADLVIANRYIKNSGIINLPLAGEIFSSLANRLCKFAIESTLSDYTNGYRIYSKRAMKFTSSHSGKIGDGFILLSTIIMQLSKANYKIVKKETVFTNGIRVERSLSANEVVGAIMGLYKTKSLQTTL